MTRVIAGLRATYESLASTGQMASFDFFVLSDSTNPDRWVEEEAAWAELCKEVDGFGHIFYRHRRPNIKRKSGNIADFCRRWGRSYRYMVVLDADSIMNGGTLVRLVRLMEQNPDVGILQTAPAAVGRDSTALTFFMIGVVFFAATGCLASSSFTILSSFLLNPA